MMVDEDKPYIGISSELNADNTAVTVKVNITANSKSTGGRFNLVYDNSQLQVASSSSGAYIAGTTNYIHEAYADNIVRVVWAGTKELNDAGEIMSVTFNIIGDEKETLMYIDGAKLSDTSGAKFDVQAASTMIKLYQEIIPTTAITLDKENLNLIVGQTATLTATVSPDNATNKAVVWSSSNENVATVSNGIVTAVAAGETTITVRQENNELNDTCTVIVTEPVQKEKVLTPTASKDSGSVQGGTTIELSTGTANATIYYTTDGSVPNASKTKYTGAITITEDTVIKAIAVKDGYDDSDIATFSYTVLNENAPTVYVSEVTGSAGSEVVVTLHIKNNPGVLGMMLQLSYDPALTLTALEQSTGESDSALETLDFTPGKNLTANPINIAWDGVEADETNGKILNMYFTIPEGAENGATYDIELSYEDGDVYDNDYNDIELTVANGTITIKNFTLGDINDDGKINMKDVTMLRRGVVGGYGITLNEAADVNCDGKTNMKDVTILRRYVVGGYGVTLG